MKIFIENEAGSSEKNLFDEKTLEYKKTVAVSCPYPYPYGFMIGTTSGDGDNLDCFVLTSQKLHSREIVEVNPIGMFEQIEDRKNDPKILAVLDNEKDIAVTEEIQNTLRSFISRVFSHKPNKTISIGKFFGKEEAVSLIERSKDS